MKACLTGSRVYGTPRPDSDLDCVLLIENQEDLYLLEMMDDKTKPRMTAHAMTKDGRGYAGVSLRYGNLNVIAVLNDEKVYKAWEKGTEFLKSIKPVTKSQASLIFETMFNVVRPENPSPSTGVDI